MEIERGLFQIAGISGMGKSYLTKNEVIPGIAKNQPVIIFDKMGEYAGPGAKDVPEKWNDFNSGRDFLEATKESEVIENVNVVKCEDLNDYKILISFFYALGAPVCLILDEAHFIFDEPDLKSLSNTIKNIARFGRHKGISLVLISQRIKDVPPTVRSQFEGLISFKQLEKSDIDSLKSKGWENSENLLDLDPRKYIVFGSIPKYLQEKLKSSQS